MFQVVYAVDKNTQVESYWVERVGGKGLAVKRAPLRRETLPENSH